MVQKITWSDDADLTLENALQYLEHNFSKIEIQKFTERIKQKVILIKSKK